MAVGKKTLFYVVLAVVLYGAVLVSCQLLSPESEVGRVSPLSYKLYAIELLADRNAYPRSPLLRF